MTAGRDGFALVLSMLLVLALAVLGMGLLAVGTREQSVAGSLARRAQAQRWAEAAALQVVGTWSTRAAGDLAIGGVRSVPIAGPGAATIERIDSALFLLRGVGSISGPDGETRAAAGLLVRVLLPDRLARGLPGALSATGPVMVPGRVDGVASCGEPSPGVVAPAVVADAGAVTGDPAILSGAPPVPASPDPFDPALAALLADVANPGSPITPRPATAGGVCVPDAWNWGSPDPGHPCYGHHPTVLAADLTVDGGVGGGVLIVDGDLRVTGGAELAGVIVVRGHLQLEAGSTLRGAVRAGSATIGGAVIRDGCAMEQALSTPALDRAFRPPLRAWIPVH